VTFAKDSGISISVVRRLNEADAAAIQTLTEAATEADGVGPLSEHVRLQPEVRRRRGRLALHRPPPHPPGNELIGYAHLDKTDLVEGPSAELVVAPSARRDGVGGALLDSLKLKLSRRRGDGPLRLWAPAPSPGADRLAKSRGMELFRELWLMARPLTGPDSELPPSPAVEGLTLAAFRPGVDDAAWLAPQRPRVRPHPEQGSMTLDDLRQRMAEPWFDPAGFFLGWRGDKLVAFHWTKVHGGDDHGSEDSDSSADHRGPRRRVRPPPRPDRRGLRGRRRPGRAGGRPGKALTLAGLHHLQDRGLAEVMLYVDADNLAAVQVYTKLGFARRSVDVMYRGVDAAR